MRLDGGAGGALVLRSEVLERAGVPHAFATRRGGVSAGCFESLNFGNPGELPLARRDPAANIRENYQRLLSAAGCGGRGLVEVHQVHGAGVLVVHAGTPAHAGARDTKADAIITDDPARGAAVRIADCAPVLLASGDGAVVAAVHAGWRGVVAGVVPAAVEAMKGLGAGGVIAAVGPCIGRGAFEVGPEVAAEFRRVFGEAAPLRPGRGDRLHAGLAEAIGLQLRAAGAAEVDIYEGCTFGQPDLFFSHRRDRERSGRMAAVIGPRL
ncbi:MAG: peptidoglycan editing factor PgeF [Phycisphaerales bacterium]